MAIDGAPPRGVPLDPKETLDILFVVAQGEEKKRAGRWGYGAEKREEGEKKNRERVSS